MPRQFYDDAATVCSGIDVVMLSPDPPLRPQPTFGAAFDLTAELVAEVSDWRQQLATLDCPKVSTGAAVTVLERERKARVRDALAVRWDPPVEIQMEN